MLATLMIKESNADVIVGVLEYLLLIFLRFVSWKYKISEKNI